MRPTVWPCPLMNHRFPSEPLTIFGPASCPAGNTNSEIFPDVVIRPIFPNSVNQIAPSGPTVIACGTRPAGIGYSMTPPEGASRPILPHHSVNHKAPSGPDTIEFSRPLWPETRYS